MTEEKKKKPVGRPREHDRDEIATQMLEWVKDEESVSLNQFCCTREPPLSPSMVLLWSKECIEFRRAYEKTKAYIGFRREQRLNSGKLHVKAFDLNATVYDLFTKEDRREQAKYESDLKKEADKEVASINFKVNYAPGTESSVQVLPEAISDKGSSSS
jgi:hypothetical protein